MSDEKMDSERAAFEDWADSQWPGAKREQLKCDAYGEYLNSIYRDLWRGWQARASLPVGVPDGWKLVPVEPTREMIDAVVNYDREVMHATWVGTWREYLAAAPAAPTVKAKHWKCDTCEESGVFGDDGSGPFDCYKCGKKAAAQIGQETPETPAVTGLRGAAHSPALPVAGVEEVEVVAHIWQHDETGRIGFVDQQQVDWGFEKNNPRLHLYGPLMTVAQHNRIVAALSAQQAGAVSVPVELLHRLIKTPFDPEECLTLDRGEALRELRAIISSSERGGE